MRLEAIIKDVVLEHRAKLLHPEALPHVSSPDSFDINLCDFFDQFAGTSTGGMMAVYREWHRAG